MASEKGNGEFAVYRRILRIDELISEGTFPGIKELMADREIEGSRATVFRALDFMKNELQAPIEFDRTRKGYYYTERTFRLPTIFTGEQEMFALAVMENMVSNLRGTPFFDDAKTALGTIRKSTVKNPNSRKILSEYTSADDSGHDWIKDRYVFLDDCKLSVPGEVWKILETAFRENREIEFDYHGNWNTSKTRRHVQPYQAVFSESAWWLWAFDCGRKDFRLFSLSRIENIILKPGNFTPLRKDDFRNHTDGIFGAYSDVIPDTVFSARFWNEAVPFMKERVWGRDQEITENPDGSITLTFTNNQWLPFLRLVLGFGMNAKALAPQGFAEEWQENVEGMLKR